MPGTPTRLDEIEHLGSPPHAPRTIRFSAENVRLFQHLRMMSFPGGHAKERGGTIVADKEGRLSVQNVGGLGSTAGSFFPNLKVRDPAKFKAIGTFHTHPYDRSEGSMNGVSFSGGDIGHLLNNLLTISVVQSGPRLFVFLRTALSPTPIDYAAVNQVQNEAIAARHAGGRTFQQASRIEAQLIAPMYSLAYYQGSNGVVTRVSPV
ncbi:hypothetical protein [Sphingomonas jatrophae]|uniref:Uncharacterized protein n=1 Tax=Sphingomonas jatrophae TaxID=1166337 RepID=A0A1I6M360_9SPHN|nr:hypothetical protein [Sphingomonas jatrophae]SFS10078.1 hypothetical protein SAMN05192580_3366 [Sphingomonas jatrophae]